MPLERSDSLDHRHGTEILRMLADGLDQSETYDIVLPPIESRHRAAPRRYHEHSARSRRVAASAAVMKTHRETYQDLKRQAVEASRTLAKSIAARDSAAAQLRREEEELETLMARVYELADGDNEAFYEYRTARAKGTEDLHWWLMPTAHGGDVDGQRVLSRCDAAASGGEATPAATPSALCEPSSQARSSSGDHQRQRCHDREKKAQRCLKELRDSLKMCARQEAPCWLDCYNRAVDEVMSVLREEIMESMNPEESAKELKDILHAIEDELSRPARELPRSLLMPRGTPPLPLPFDELCEALEKQMAVDEESAQDRAKTSFEIARAHAETKEALKNERAYHAALEEEFSRDFEIGERRLNDLREKEALPGGDEWWMASFHTFLLREMREIERQVEIDEVDLKTIAALKPRAVEGQVGASSDEVDREIEQLVSRRHMTDRARLRTIELWLENARRDTATQLEESCEPGELRETLIPYHCQLSRAETRTSYGQTDSETYVSSWKAWQGERELTDGARIETTITYRRNNEDMLIEVSLEDMSHPLYHYTQIASIFMPSVGAIELDLGLADPSWGEASQSSRSTTRKGSESKGTVPHLEIEEQLKEAASRVADLIDVDYVKGLPVVSLRKQCVAWRDGSVALKTTTKKLDEMAIQKELVELVSQDVLTDGIQLPFHASLFVPRDPLVGLRVCLLVVSSRLLELKLPPIATSVVRALRALNVECNSRGIEALAGARSRGSDPSLWIDTSKRTEALVRAMLIETNLFASLAECPTLLPSLTLTEICIRGELTEEDSETLGFRPLAVDILVHPDGRLGMRCTRQHP
ncbi:hypothetical protein FOL47_004220 [Perkinsus chesapeaki]|uniref:Uncharacterized protein n=1 Tax=Perkinsus chesapeaki TaxID=330153 RepID=A0A7J6M3Q2_PERCH|nr:hypothetical protein FOL47_004220 [Perkinsus chesapeaki]